jgi:hypothetical protein
MSNPKCQKFCKGLFTRFQLLIHIYIPKEKVALEIPAVVSVNGSGQSERQFASPAIPVHAILFLCLDVSDLFTCFYPSKGKISVELAASGLITNVLHTIAKLGTRNCFLSNVRLFDLFYSSLTKLMQLSRNTTFR